MKLKPLLTTGLLSASLLLLTPPLGADLRIDTTDQRGQTSSFTGNGKMLRIDNPADPGYVLIELASGTVKMVNPQQRQVMVMDGASRAASAGGAPLNIQMKRAGKGPKIAGYTTRKYQLIANGQPCGTVFGSKKLLDNSDVRKMFDAMQRMQQHANSMMGQMRSMVSDCDRAQMQFARLIETSGAPMRVVDRQGQLQSEVLKVNTRFKTADGYYNVPEGFSESSMQAQMQQAQQQQTEAMKQMQQGMPDMNQLMQQLQQSGGQMTPEMQQQMQQKIQQQMQDMQQMMQQYQQQQ